MNVTFIGSGRLATQLATALSRSSSHVVRQVCSPTYAHACALAERVGAEACSGIDEVAAGADVYIVAVRDDVLPEVLERLCTHIYNNVKTAPVVLHTAGSIPMQVFSGTCASTYGVLYPMQTFSLERQIDFTHVPVFIEGSDDHALTVARSLAESVSSSVHQMSSGERRYLHLAAVFACNFPNHLFALADDLLREHGLDISIMLPLIHETVAKLEQLSPREAQTGPAARRDMRVMAAQQELLGHKETAQQIYQLLSRSIMES